VFYAILVKRSAAHFLGAATAYVRHKGKIKTWSSLDAATKEARALQEALASDFVVYEVVTLPEPTDGK
jgi:hypothetical protein